MKGDSLSSSEEPDEVTVPPREQLRDLERRREEGFRRIDKLRREALRGKPYNWEEVDALLWLADNYDGPPRFGEGMVEMQRSFMKAKNRIKSCDIGKWLKRDEPTTDEHR
ncbi:MAG: hypothetical protein K1Y02_02305 [Candidatus Hydrogenedentes bacterium]|nr:hypothetical protein [Candidatus Hydrogenedentota bacterium]